MAKPDILCVSDRNHDEDFVGTDPEQVKSLELTLNQTIRYLFDDADPVIRVNHLVAYFERFHITYRSVTNSLRSGLTYRQGASAFDPLRAATPEVSKRCRQRASGATDGERASFVSIKMVSVLIVSVWLVTEEE